MFISKRHHGRYVWRYIKRKEEGDEAEWGKKRGNQEGGNGRDGMTYE